MQSSQHLLQGTVYLNIIVRVENVTIISLVRERERQRDTNFIERTRKGCRQGGQMKERETNKEWKKRGSEWQKQPIRAIAEN